MPRVLLGVHDDASTIAFLKLASCSKLPKNVEQSWKGDGPSSHLARVELMHSVEKSRSDPIATPSSLHHPIGASTGYMEGARGSWPDLIEEAIGVSPYAAELAALSEPEFPDLSRYLQQNGHFPFLYVSVHAPSKSRHMPEQDLVERLGALPHFVNAMVVHPDIIQHPILWAHLGRRLVIENMDDRKDSGKTPEELAVLFDQLPAAGFCFDIAHAHSVDRSMSLARDLLNRFRLKLRHLHLSSLRGGKHVTLTDEDEALFVPLLERCRDLPWIFEAPPPDSWLQPRHAYGERITVER